MKRLVGIIVTLLLLLVLVGCAVNPSRYTLEEFLEQHSDYVDQMYNEASYGTSRLEFKCRDYTMEIYLMDNGVGRYDERLAERFMRLTRGTAVIYDDDGHYYSFYDYTDVLPWLRSQH